MTHEDSGHIFALVPPTAVKVKVVCSSRKRAYTTSCLMPMRMQSSVGQFGKLRHDCGTWIETRIMPLTHTTFSLPAAATSRRLGTVVEAWLSLASIEA